MRRRDFICLLGSATALWWPLATHAQQSVKHHRIGYLWGGIEATEKDHIAEFNAGMRDLGHVEGQDFVFDARFADGDFERLPSLAKELLALKPDVLFVGTTAANLAAKAATSTVPIVMVAVADPMGAGLIANLSRPGGNITGITNVVAGLTGKRLEILKEIVPAASKIAVMANPDDPNMPLQMRNAEPAAKSLHVQLEPVLAIRSADDLPSVFETAKLAHADAGLRMVDPLEIALRKQTVALAAQYRLPIIYSFRETVEAGGLASYGTNLGNQYRQAATFVHKILNGSKPADLPVEQPTKFEFVINLKTAKSLGLNTPPSLLATADEVIE
jgi:putative tryptophan/tyrosine transport system substrate-binding protein